MGNDSFIDLSLGNIWHSWFAFRKGKRATQEMHVFQYDLERNLRELYEELKDGAYYHGDYTHFTVCDNKRRRIAVAGIRDRVVHRLIYDYLVPIHDKGFIYDAWSCRKGKGLLACIERTQKFLTAHSHSYVWRADIRKFFDSVNHKVLLKILARRVHEPKASWLIREVIRSFPTVQRERAYQEPARYADRQPDQSDFRQYLPERTGSVCET
jgi:RNA-directed DNA polymerase